MQDMNTSSPNYLLRRITFTSTAFALLVAAVIVVTSDPFMGVMQVAYELRWWIAFLAAFFAGAAVYERFVTVDE